MKKNYIIILMIIFGSVSVYSQSLIKHSPGSHSHQSNPMYFKDMHSRSASNQRNGTHGNIQTNTAGCIYSDSFDGANDTTSLKSRGYLIYYRGLADSEGIAPIWFQGDPSLIPSMYGPADGYVASNFNSVIDSNDIDNWLVLPALALNAGDMISFFSQSPIPPPNVTFPDSLHVMYSASGDSVPEDTSWHLLGEFEVTIAGSWEYRSFTIPTAGVHGRLAIRYAVVNGGPIGRNSNYVGIDELNVFTPSAVDGSLLSLSSPSTGCSLSATEPVSVMIVNRGTLPINGFQVGFSIDSGSVVSETVASVIPAGGSATYTFTATADLSALGNHFIIVGVNALGDSVLCNNVYRFDIDNFPISTPLTTAYTMDFESTDDFSNWKIENDNGDNTTWDTISNQGPGVNAFSGNVCMRKAASATEDDDWLFTTCLDMTGGSNYTLDYWFKEFDVATACGLESSIGTDPSSAAMSQSLLIDPLPADTTYQHEIVHFTVPTSGVYFIGFHAFSTVGTSSIRLDDINLDNGNSIGIDETNVSRNVSIYPNPNNGTFYIRSSGNSKNVNIEVINLSGQIIYSMKSNNLYQQMIDLSKEVNGVYTIRITSDSFVENHRVVISR